MDQSVKVWLVGIDCRELVAVIIHVLQCVPYGHVSELIRYRYLNQWQVEMSHGVGVLVVGLWVDIGLDNIAWPLGPPKLVRCTRW